MLENLSIKKPSNAKKEPKERLLYQLSLWSRLDTSQKVGEEATEVVIAAKNADKDEMANETADLPSGGRSRRNWRQSDQVEVPPARQGKSDLTTDLKLTITKRDIRFCREGGPACATTIFIPIFPMILRRDFCDYLGPLRRRDCHH